MTSCSNCGHPGAHAVTIEPGAAYPDTCDQCQPCAQERRRRASSGRLDGERTSGRHETEDRR